MLFECIIPEDVQLRANNESTNALLHAGIEGGRSQLLYDSLSGKFTNITREDGLVSLHKAQSVGFIGKLFLQ